jgi:ribonuclease I
MLALTWAPNFCATHKDKEQCKSMPGSFAADHLTIHGLWPNYNDQEAVGHPHAWPDFCSPYNACSTESPAMCNPDPASIPSDMKTYGPGYLTDSDFLANHEWPKHGSCTGLTADVYFSEAIKSLLALPGDRGTPQKLTSNLGKKIKATELRAAFEHPESVVLSCDAKCNLSQVGICLANGANADACCQVCPESRTMSPSLRRLSMKRTRRLVWATALLGALPFGCENPGALDVTSPGTGDVTAIEQSRSAVTLAQATAAVTVSQTLIDAFGASLKDDLLTPYYPTAHDGSYGGFVEDRSGTWALQQDSDKFIVGPGEVHLDRCQGVAVLRQQSHPGSPVQGERGRGLPSSSDVAGRRQRLRPGG